MFPTHPFSGVTVPVSGFLIVTRRLRDCVKSRNGEGKGERHIRSAFGASATSRQPLPAAMPLSFYLPGSLLLTHMPQPFRAVYR